MASVPIFDGHNDVLTAPDAGDFLTGRRGGHVDLPKMLAGGMRGGIFAVYTPSPRLRKRPLPRTDGVTEFEMPHELPRARAAAWTTAAAGRLFGWERDGHVTVARSAVDLDRAERGDGPPVAVLHLEGAEAIDEELVALDTWYAAGLRSLGPVWSRPNRFGHGVPFVYPGSPDTGPGLTVAGRRLVERCGELGVMVDLAHLDEQGFWDVAEAEAGPLVVSHGAVHALSPCTRNLTDRQLDAIGESGGLIGLIYGSAYLRADFRPDPGTSLDLIGTHARYVAERIGVDHLALGSDFDGVAIPAALGDAAGLPGVLDVLRDAGFSGDELEKIAWGNWRRVLAAWWR